MFGGGVRRDETLLPMLRRLEWLNSTSGLRRLEEPDGVLNLLKAAVAVAPNRTGRGQTIGQTPVPALTGTVLDMIQQLDRRELEL